MLFHCRHSIAHSASICSKPLNPGYFVVNRGAFGKEYPIQNFCFMCGMLVLKLGNGGHYAEGGTVPWRHQPPRLD